MKKIITLIVCAFLASCSITEKLIVKENFEGDFRLGFDMSPMLKLNEKKENLEKKNKKIDSTFVFSDIFKNLSQDSLNKIIAENKIGYEMLKRMSFHLNVDEENKIFSYDIGINIPNINNAEAFPKSEDIGNLLLKTDKNFGDLSSLKKKDSLDEDKETSEIKYFYDGKLFTKNTINKFEGKIISKSLISKKKKKKSKKDEFAQFGKKVDDLLKECKYKMEYHFPKKIKSVSLKNAVISEDKKSFIYEIPFEQYENNSNLDFNVVFE